MANGIEVAKAFVTIVPSMEGSQSTITQELTGITTPAAEEAGEAGGSSFASKMAVGITAAAATITAAVTAATAAAVTLGKEFIETATDVAAYGDEVDKTSQKLGISAQAYQEWDYVMQLAGTDMSSMTVGFKTLTNHIADATSGSESAIAMFESLGLTMEDLQSMSTEEIFAATVSSLQNMEEGAERSALAVDLFGKSGQNMAALLNMSNEETEEAIALANEYGMVMSDDAVQASADYTDALTTLEKTFTGLKNNLMSQFLPSLTTVMDGLSAIFAGDETGITAIKSGIEELVGNISAISPQLFELASAIVTSLLAGFGPMLPSVVESIFSFINEALITLTGLLPQLMPVITTGLQSVLSILLDSTPLIISSLLTLITDLVTWLASGDNITRFVNGLIELVGEIASQLSVVLPVILPALVQIITELASALTNADNIGILVAAVLEVAAAIFVALVECVPVLIDFTIDTLLNLADIIADGLEFIMPYIISFATNALNTFKSWGENVKNAITNFINNVRTSITTWLTNLRTSFSTAFTTIQSKISEIVTKAQNLVSNIITTISQLPSQVISIGSNLVEGLWNGINNKITWVKNKIWGMGSQITSAIKSVFGIASPSKVFAEVGDFLAQGLGVGFESGMDDVESDMLDSMEGLTGNMTAEVSAYGAQGAAMLGNNSTYNGGAITINVYGAEGQDVNSLADVIAVRLEEMTTRKAAVYG